MRIDVFIKVLLKAVEAYPVGNESSFVGRPFKKILRLQPFEEIFKLLVTFILVTARFQTRHESPPAMNIRGGDY